MKDDNWDLISGDDAHEIEVLNYSNQVNVIEALVRFTSIIMALAPTDVAALPAKWR